MTIDIDQILIICVHGTKELRLKKVHPIQYNFEMAFYMAIVSGYLGSLGIVEIADEIQKISHFKYTAINLICLGSI